MSVTHVAAINCGTLGSPVLSQCSVLTLVIVLAETLNFVMKDEIFFLVLNSILKFREKY